ncbi:MAG: M14 family zinc carboxypeptidase [Candidatus Cloacimonetes bacterium]|nr:M14 family zinc carboxypeptidase [Candidatus Cloacimonadota bacterium]
MKKIILFLFCISLLALQMNSQNIYPLDSDYHTFESMENEIIQTAIRYPMLVSWEIIGYTATLKLPVYAVKLSDDVNRQESYEPSVVIIGQHHSEEPLGVEVSLHILNRLAAAYNRYRFAKKTVNRFEIWIIPTLNPEGMSIVNSGKYFNKRENLSDTNFNGILEIEKDGVDLNRNYPFNWDTGNSKNSNIEEVFDFFTDSQFCVNDRYYRGPFPSSENEIVSITHFFDRIQPQLAIFYHSSISSLYAEKIFFPWKWGRIHSDNYHDMAFLASYLAERLPKDYVDDEFYDPHFHNSSLSGFARDYVYHKNGTLSLNVEMGGIDSTGASIVFPANNQMANIKKKHYKAFTDLLEVFYDNLLSGKIEYKNKQLAALKPIFIEDEPLNYRYPLQTDENGYFHKFFLPEKKNTYFTIDNTFFDTEVSKGEKFVIRKNPPYFVDTDLEKPLRTCCIIQKSTFTSFM